MEKKVKSEEIYSNPINIKYLKTLLKLSYSDNHFFNFNNLFCVFKSIKDIIILIYHNKQKSIISFDIINNQKLNEIKNAHLYYIVNLIHFFDKINNRDLILSLSGKKLDIKVWDNNNLECILNIKNVFINFISYSTCFLSHNNNNYIVICIYNGSNSYESIKVFDFNGKKTKTINDSKDPAYFIDNYFDVKSSKNYIFTGNKGYVKSYDFNENKIYHKYFDKDYFESCLSAKINDSEKEAKLIIPCNDGIIRIWNFHERKLLKKIKVLNGFLSSFCLWNEQYLFINDVDNGIKLINIEKGNVVKKLQIKNEFFYILKKIKDSKYGEFLISLDSNGIKIWGNLI